MTNNQKEILFPHYTQDITSMRRTLFHTIKEDDYKVDDQLCLIGARNVPRGYVAYVTAVRRVRLVDLTADDEAKLNCSKEDYLARWNALHPAAEEAFAVEFRYGFVDYWDKAVAR